MAEVHREEAEALQVLNLQPANVHVTGTILHRPYGGRLYLQHPAGRSSLASSQVPPVRVPRASGPPPPPHRRERPAEAAAWAGIAQAHTLGIAGTEAEAEVTLAESLWRRGRAASTGDAIERERAQAAHAHEPELDVTIAIAGARLKVTSPRTRDWGAVGRELSQLADEEKAGGWIL